MPIGLLKPPTFVVTEFVAVLMTDTVFEEKFDTARRVPALLSARWYGLEPTVTVATAAPVRALMTDTVFEFTFDV
jgi:hypothetical protein